MDPYAEALGVSKAPAPSADPYAAALGIQPPKEAVPDFVTNDPAKMRAALAKSDPAMLEAFDRQFPGYGQGSKAGGGRGFVNPPMDQLSPSGIPGAPPGQIAPPATNPVRPDQPETWWDKLKGAGEAVNQVASSVPAGVIGGWSGFARGIATGQEPEPLMASDTAKVQKFLAGDRPLSQAGQRYTENIGKASESLVGIAPLAEVQAGIQATGPVLQQAGDFARAKLSQTPQVPRIEPTFDKPRYVQVNGEWQIKNPEMPGGAPEVAAAVKPSLDTATPVLQDAVKQAAKKGPIAEDVLQRHLEADSLPVPMRLSAGQASLDPQRISQEMNNRGKFPELANLYNAQGKQLVQNLDAIKQQAAPGAAAANHVEAGQALVDAYKTMDAPIRADISAKYKAFFDAAGGDIPLNGEGLVSSIDTALAKQMKGRYLPSAIRGDLEDIKSGAPLTFEQFENMRTNLAAEARKAQRAGDGNALAAVNIARNQVESLPLQGEAASLKPLADAARSAAKARFDAIKADPAYSAAVNDSASVGDLSPLADSFVQQYIVKGKKSNLAQMSRNLSGVEGARETAAAGAIDFLSKKAGADPESGAFSQAGYNNAWNELSPKQAFLFDAQTGQYLDNLGKVAKYTQVQPRGSFVNNSNTLVGYMANKAAFAAEKAGNFALPGLDIGTEVRDYMARRAAQKAVTSHTAPGAGITDIKDFPR